MKGNECIRRVYNEQGKSPCLTTSVGGHRQPKVFDYTKEKARKLTPLECERLQTFPEGHTEGISNTQRYKALGNSWTVDVIAHIFKQLL
jgi:site-specific DNA-cytosine methylase